MGGDLTLAEIEHLLSDKLLNGYVLLESSCPVCSTPLVKNNHMVPKELSMDRSALPARQVSMVLSESFDQPFKPVPGVPICVACQSHVITHESEISILEQCDSLKDKGSILVALKDSDDSQYSEESDNGHDAMVSSPLFGDEEKKEDDDNMMMKYTTSAVASYDDDVIGEPMRQVEDDEDEIVEDIVESAKDRPTVLNPGTASQPILVERPTVMTHPVFIHLEDLPSPVGATPMPVMGHVGRDVAQQPLAAPHPIVQEPQSTPQIVSNDTSLPSIPVAQNEEPVVVTKSSTLDETTATASLGGSKKEYATGAEGLIQEYSIRREVATKVLGAKMLKGYTLQETTCDRCGMPQMEKSGQISCVVCPALAKKAIKKLRAQERVEEEKVRLEREVRVKKNMERKLREDRLERERLEREEIERIEQEKRQVEERIAREQEVERLRLAQRRREMDEERARLIALEALEEARIASLEAEENRLLEQARQYTVAAAREQELRTLESQAKRQEEERRLFEIQKETESRLALERQKQKVEEAALLEEALRLEAYEAKSLASTTEAMKKDLLEQEHRRRMVDKVRLDREIIELEEVRRNEEMEVRRLAEERRAEEEGRMVASLEADAASKALAAEEAIRKAKIALEQVTSTKRSIIAQTIAFAEKEAIAETEETLKAEREHHKENIVLPSESDLHCQRWETLRLEGRAIMTRRVLQGWQLIPQHCEGSECQMSPLITKLGRTECVVCGGTGDGCDGVYASEQEDDVEMVDIVHLDPTLLPPRDILTRDFVTEEHDSNDHPTFYGNQEQFEEHRDMVSKEIGKRMLLGWTLVDASCPKCVMPLMMDNAGNSDICVLCGNVEQYFDDSTIRTHEMKALVDKVDDHQARDQVCDIPATDKKGEEQNKSNAPFEPMDALSLNQMQRTITTHFVDTSVEDVVEAPVNLDPEESAVPVEDALFAMIRDRANRKSNLPTPKGDPPAFTKGLSKTIYEQQQLEAPDNESSEEKQIELSDDKSIDEQAIEVTDNETNGVVLPSNSKSDEEDGEITIIIPKNFDFADPKAVKQLIKVAAGEDLDDGDQSDEEDEEEQYEEDEEDDDDELNDAIEITKSGVTHLGNDGLSTEVVTKMFLRSPYGYDFQDLGSDIGVDDIKELVDIFMATNFNEPVTDGFKRSVAQNILNKLQPLDNAEDELVVILSPPATATSAIIRLEHMPSPGDERREEYGSGGGPQTPQAFHFDDYADTQSTRSINRRTKPNPEMLMLHTSSLSTSRPPMSPTYRLPPRFASSSRREGSPIVVGGPLSATHRQQYGSSSRRSNNYSDHRSLGEVSRAESVASEALESIFAKIDQCKVTLMDATNTIDDQLAAADLLEKLAKAAMAVRAMEKQEQQAYE